MSVDDLRSQLKERGYLSHGIERWFALDPWSSRAFWVELVTLALKAATLIAAFGALPLTAVMLFRNAPLGAVETIGLFLSYGAVWLVTAFVVVVVIALVLKIRPALPIDTPRALLILSLAASGLLVTPLIVWWWWFDTAPAQGELVTGAALTVLFFLIATVVISAALLSFSIYELQRIPAIHQKPRGFAMSVAAIVLVALLFVPGYARREGTQSPPMVVTAPTTTHLALLAVDGLTYEVVQSRPDLARAFSKVTAVPPVPGRSTTERWASVGTGVRTEAHGVRALEGVRFLGASHVLQQTSRADFVLMRVAPALGVVRREPLPPTVRRRDYLWEIVAERGIPATAVNWWVTAASHGTALHTIGPEEIFPLSHGDPLQLDDIAAAQFLNSLDRRHPRFATVYLPALDVVLNRLPLDASTRLSQSLRILDAIAQTARLARVRHYDVVLVGLPGDGQQGQGVIASLPSIGATSAWDITPTLLDLLGFPASKEMPGQIRPTPRGEQRIASYGNRSTAGAPAAPNQEYYDNLKSLGYIK